MKRRRRFIVWGSILAALIVLLLAGWWIVVPWAVSRQLEAAFHSAGIVDVDFDIRRVTLWRLELTHFQRGNGDTDRVGEAVVHYSPEMLWRGRVGDVRIADAEVVVNVSEGRVGLAAMSRQDAHDTHESPESSDPPDASAALDLPFDRIELASSTIVLQLPDRALRIPAEGSFVSRGEGRWNLDLTLSLNDRPVRVGGVIGPLPGDVELAIGGERLDAAGVAAILSAYTGEDLRASGAMGLDVMVRGSDGRGAVQMRLRPTDMSSTIVRAVASAGTATKRESTNFEGISGVFEVDITFARENRRGRAVIRDGEFNSASLALSAEGINGSVDLADLAGLVTGSPQRIAAGRVKKGEFVFTDTAIVFQADRQSIRIDHAQGKWMDGTVWVEPMTIDPGASDFDATVHLADVDLRQLLEMFAGEKVTGEGRVSGRVPVRVENGLFALGRGIMQAAPGGTLQFKDLRVMEAALAQSQRPEIKEQVLQSLSDFRFDVLQCRLVPEGNGLTAEIALAGRGRAGQPAQPLEVALRVRGVDELIALYMGIRRQFGGG